MSGFLRPQEPSVAFGAGVFLVAFRNAGLSSVCTRRVAPDGAILDASPLRLSPLDGTTDRVAVAFDGRQFVIAGADFDGNVHVAHVDPGAASGPATARPPVA